jgi:hypothetical protein
MQSQQLPPVLGVTTMAKSLSVALATDQSPLPISGSINAAITSLPQLPPALGTQNTNNSLSVVFASNIPNVPSNIVQFGNTNVVTGGVAGSQGVGGLAAAGSPISGNPLLCGGSDGTNVRAFTTDTLGNHIIIGNVGSGTNDVGNCIKVGGKVSNSAPAPVSNTQRVDAWFDAYGRQVTTSISQIVLADATSASAVQSWGFNGASTVIPAVLAANYNGVSLDRPRNNMDTGALVTLASQAAGTVNSSDQVNYNGNGLNVVLYLTALSASTNVTVNIQIKDAASSQYITLLSSAAVTNSATTPLVYTVYPGVASTANVSSPMLLSRNWRIQVVVAGSGTASGTVGASVNV